MVSRIILMRSITTDDEAPAEAGEQNQLSKAEKLDVRDSCADIKKEKWQPTIIACGGVLGSVYTAIAVADRFKLPYYDIDIKHIHLGSGIGQLVEAVGPVPDGATLLLIGQNPLISRLGELLDSNFGTYGAHDDMSPGEVAGFTLTSGKLVHNGGKLEWNHSLPQHGENKIAKASRAQKRGKAGASKPDPAA